MSGDGPIGVSPALWEAYETRVLRIRADEYHALARFWLSVREDEKAALCSQRATRLEEAANILTLKKPSPPVPTGDTGGKR